LRTAGADIHVDTGFVGRCRVDDTGDVTVGDQPHRGAGPAHADDHVGVARAVENERRDVRGLDALGLGELQDVVASGRIEIDHAFRIARPDRDLLHIDVRRVQQRAFIGHRNSGDRARHVLGAQRGTLERVDRDIDFRALPGPHLLADEQHRRLVKLALADHHGAVDRQVVELAPHGVDRGLIGRLLGAASAQPRRRDRRPLGHAHDLERQDALQNQIG